jgi:glycosyltransferase involved in cell wall biosynthesis
MSVKRVAVDLRMVGGTPHGVARYALAIWDGLPQSEEIRFCAICSPRGEAHVAARRQGDEVIVARRRYLAPAEQLELPRLLARARIDLLHATSFSVPVLWRGPLVLTLHDATHLALPAYASTAALFYHRTVVRDATRRAVRVLTVSRFAARQITRFYGVSDDRLRVAPDAVSFVPKVALRTSLPPYLLYVGNGKPHKNVEVLVAARKLLRNPLLLRLCGAGLERFSAPGIEVIAEANDAVLRALYAAASIFLYPSLMEGFGLPPLEAAACGAPLLLADASALQEIWAGVAPLVPPRDAAAWAKEIDRLLADEGARRTLSEKCRVHALRFRSWKPAVDAALDAYRLGLKLSR